MHCPEPLVIPMTQKERSDQSTRLQIRSRAMGHVRHALSAMPLLLAGCSSAVLDPRGPIGQNDRTILIDSMAIMLAIVIPTIIATFAFAWWFRASNKKATYLPDWEFSGRIEMIVWAIPAMTIILLGGVTWIGSHELDPAKPIESKTAALDIQVVSLDWKWLFILPEQRVASVNQLVVPIGTPLHFTLTSSSVMNTFFVPRLGSMIYTMNGMATELYLQADEAGTYRGISGHYSGEGFSDMHFDVRAVSAEDFAHWVNQTREGGGTLDAAGYTELAKQSINIPVATYSSVERDLFAQVLSQKLAPGPGPDVENKGATQKPEIKP
jgi:cytochrome o ubiquinol oxidase subunit 2